MKSTFSCLLTALLVLICIPSEALVEVRAQFLTTSDGLSNNSVHRIYQDSKGFIWMGTLGGISCYDGNSFVSFRPNNEGLQSLSGRRVGSFMEDENGFLWIGTGNVSFSCYDLKKNCFVDYTDSNEPLNQYRYMSIFGGDVWLWGEQGCLRIVYRDGKLTSTVYSVEKQNLQSDNVIFVTLGDAGKVWIGTAKGLYCCDNGNMKCVSEDQIFLNMQSFGGTSFFLSSVGSICKIDSEQQLKEVARIPEITSRYDMRGSIPLMGKWIFFTSKGGYAFDPASGTVGRSSSELNIPRGEVMRDNRNNYWIRNQTGKLHYINSQTGEVKVLQLMPQNKVGFIDMERYFIVHDSRDIIWITTYGNGLFAYDLRTGELQHFTANSNSSDLIPSNFLLFVMEDRSGSLWIGSEYTGIAHLRILNEGAMHFYPGGKKEQSGNYSNAIRMVTQVKNGDLWLGSREGEVFVYNQNLQECKHSYKYGSNIYAICEDTAGTVWLGSRVDGLYVGKKRYVHDSADSTSLAGDNVYCIQKDSKGRMWIGTLGGGLNLAEPDSKGGYRFRHFFMETYSKRRIRAMYEDENGYIWMGTNDGLIIFDPEKLLLHPDAYYQYNLENKGLHSNEVRSIMQDSKKNIWVSEAGSGFCFCSPGKDYGNLTFTHYGVKDGLVNSMVQSFVEGDDSLVWISTEYGISCFNRKQKTFENYFFSGDMLSNVYSENSVAKLNDGRLIFGSNHGLIVINPDEVQNIHQTPSVTFTDLKLDGISVEPGADSPLDMSISYMKSIRLDYNQNSFVIDFSTLDYSSSMPPKFSYKLDAYDKDWSVPSTLNFAAYKNLNHGTYYLHVKACNAGGLWGEEAILKIVVVPPFWKTKLALLIYVLLILAALYVAYRIIRNVNNLRNKVEVEKRLTEYKLVFFTNISHEFRTPLTLIQAALEKMHTVDKIPREMAYSVKVMDKSTQRMLRLINQLLEFRKMQNNKLALSLEKTDVIAFLYEIYLSFKEVSESKKMDFRFVSTVASYEMFIDKGNLDKVVYNLLSNAFKYTPSGGKIELAVQVNESNHKITVKVTDTGVGIPKEKQDQLFKRFMHSNFLSNSVGVGLHLTHELVNVHKGTIGYEGNPEGGSVFTVVLSTDASIYGENDFLVSGGVSHNDDNTIAGHLSMMENEEFNAETKDREELADENKTQPVIPLNKRNLLIIEDDTDVREFLKNELSVYFDVMAEADGNSGLECACSYDADLIICDVLMPGLSGFEVTKKLKSDFSTSHIPIILLTALDAEESHLEGVECGADAYITKPFSTKLLLARVFKLIEQRDKLREKFSSDISMVRPVLCTSDRDKMFTEKLTDVVEKNLKNPDFTVDDFASMMALGRTIFYRKVKGVTGYAPMEYLRVMRMKKAAELLLSSGDTVAEVAYEVGFNDPLYFSKCFKAQFGVSPSAYQNNNQQKQ